MVHNVIIASAALIALATATPLPGCACDPSLFKKRGDSIYSPFSAYDFDGSFQRQAGGVFPHCFAGLDGFRFPVAFQNTHEFDRNRQHADFHDKTVFMKHKDAHVAKDSVHDHRHKNLVA
ncbi:hypothetical protein GGI12_005752 [Dipsacomyces acuminosporus]|nr:hypothetical protein GGI12_005752 [Dipsacomyces acuminosporus]